MIPIRWAAKLSAASAAAQILSFLATLVITRIYEPEDYGQYVLVGAIVGILLSLVTYKMDFVYAVTASKIESENILFKGLLISIVGVLVTSALLVLSEISFLSL